jgi:integral membrane protein
VTPKTLFRIFASAEMVTWAGLITALIVRASSGYDGLVSIAGGLHGFVFLCYGVSTVFVWINQRWKTGIGVVGLITTIIPFATLPFEIWAHRRGLLEGGWRLAPGGDTPRGLFEHLQAWVLRRPIVAIVLVLVAVVAVFTTLLWLGPPGGPRG